MVRGLLTHGAYLYFKVRSPWAVWFYILNRRGRRRYQKDRPALDPAGERIVRDLKENGIAVSHLKELFPEMSLLASLREETARLKDKAAPKTYKAFLRQLWDEPPEAKARDPFVRLALDKRILDIVNGYLEMHSYLYYLTLNQTVPVPPAAEAVQSQRWHRDPEDKKLCKIFVYLNDVDEAAGPFIYVRGTQFGGKWGHIYPQNPPRGVYLREEEVKRAIPENEIFTAAGRAGTVIFCDTAGIHKGGYATAKERFMFTAGYCTSACPWPLRFRFEDGFKEWFLRQNHYPAARRAIDFRPAPFSSKVLRLIKKNLS